MPIPELQQQEDQPAERRAALRLVDTRIALAEAARAPLTYPRAFAHFLDLCLVQGFSLYSAKLFSVLILSFHAGAISEAGKVAAPVFRQAFAWSSGQLLAASFAALAVAYFVGLPLVAGRTLGMGLLGLRIVSDDGAALSVRQLALRLGGCAMGYASAGLVCILGLRQNEGRFLQDRLSGSRVVRN